MDLDLDHQANTYSGMVGKSRLMYERVFRKIDQAASVDATVLLLGETGSGKELASKAIHKNSQRSERPWIPIHCAAIPEGLLESELYGHEKGAFTDAKYARKGAFREAHNGTLYLDEIGSMPKAQQPKLLRVLEDMLIKPLGSDKLEKVDVRVIAATNENLYKAIREGKFRSDLYYRLSAVIIDIPPLRERLGDIPMLIKYFMEKYQKQYGKIVRDFTTDEYIEYMRYGWPGNVRELENAVKGIVTMGDNPLEKLLEFKKISALILGDVLPAQSAHLLENYNPSTLRGIQRDAIIQALSRHDGNRTQAAKELGISIRTIQNHVRKIREELETEQKPEAESQG